jgi:dihydroorotate dehydrogenase
VAREKIGVVVKAAGGLPVIGVGGIERAEQVRELLALGCAAVQLYSALIYEGPGLPARIHRELVRSRR